jgi:hypothetical protein
LRIGGCRQCSEGGRAAKCPQGQSGVRRQQIKGFLRSGKGAASGILHSSSLNSRHAFPRTRDGVDEIEDDKERAAARRDDDLRMRRNCLC